MPGKARARAWAPTPTASGTRAAGAPRGDGRISCRNVYKWFPGGIVLEDLSLTVGAGEFVCIVGPSGCGKTTLLRLMAGLAEIDHGDISIGGTRVAGPSPAVAVVFQHFGLFPWKTVYHNVALPLRLARASREETDRRVRELLAIVGLAGHEDKFPALLRLRDRLQQTIVFITHSIDEAITLGDRIIVMASRPGRITREFPVEIDGPRTIAQVRRHPGYEGLREQIWAELRGSPPGTESES